MRTPLVVGNWKMHGTQTSARELAQSIRDGLKRPRGVDVVVCPPFTALAAVEQAGVTSRIGYISTAGGAFLEYLEGRVLPGVAALDDA